MSTKAKLVVGIILGGMTLMIIWLFLSSPDLGG